MRPKLTEAERAKLARKFPGYVPESNREAEEGERIARKQSIDAARARAVEQMQKPGGCIPAKQRRGAAYKVS